MRSKIIHPFELHRGDVCNIPHDSGVSNTVPFLAIIFYLGTCGRRLFLDATVVGFLFDDACVIHIVPYTSTTGL